MSFSEQSSSIFFPKPFTTFRVTVTIHEKYQPEPRFLESFQSEVRPLPPPISLPVGKPLGQSQLVTGGRGPRICTHPKALASELVLWGSQVSRPSSCFFLSAHFCLTLPFSNSSFLSQFSSLCRLSSPISACLVLCLCPG